MRIALDSSVAAHLLTAERPGAPLPAWRESQEFLRHAQDVDHELFLPAPALAELLAFYPADRHRDVRQVLDQVFVILTFDDIAAEYAGRYWNAVHPVKDADTPQPCLKVDCEILACAVRWEAEGLCTRDKGQTNLATLHVPELADFLVGPPSRFLAQHQRDLFEDVLEDE